MTCSTVYFHPDDCLEEDKKFYGHLRCELYRCAETGYATWAKPAGEYTIEYLSLEEILPVAEARLAYHYNAIPITELQEVASDIQPEDALEVATEMKRIPTGETYSRLAKTWVMFVESE